MSIIKKYTKSLTPTKISGSPYNDNTIKQDISNVIVNLSAEQSPLDKEASFRLSYASELKSKKQQIYDNDRGFKELDDEVRSVRQQMMRTPGRRGEIIKEEEISKEFARRFFENSK
jgi:hypothetical protein